MPGRTERTAGFVQSLERGLAVIRAFDADHPELSLSDVARATGLTRAAAGRFLRTLVELGYMRADGRLFSLRPRVLELGYAYLSGLGLPEVAQPHLERLVAAVRESSSVSVLDGVEIVYVARVPTKRIMTVAINVGTRFPAYATSMGRVLLAARPDDWIAGYLASARLEPLTRHTITDPGRMHDELMVVRKQGWALVDQELEEGLRSIAAPLHGPDQQVVAAVNVSAHASRGGNEMIRTELLPRLRSAVALIEEDLRGGAAPRPRPAAR
jgi:IclR family pca regulon transcriptional regulator